MIQPGLARGLTCAFIVMFIWSGFFILSRVASATPLTPFDISALRFFVAFLLVAPFVHHWWPSHLPPRVLILMSLCGPGAVYSTLMYLGLANAPVAYAGVFANGFLPVFTLTFAFFASHALPSHRQVIAVIAILIGGAVLAMPNMLAAAKDVVVGVFYFLFSAAVLAFYIDGVRRYGLKPKQALAIITVPNALVFLPVWYFFLPSGLGETEWQVIAMQALFHGIGPGFLAVLLFAIAAVDLGPTPTAGISAAVPATATLIAIPILGEIPTTLEWLGLGIVSAGLAWLISRRT